MIKKPSVAMEADAPPSRAMGRPETAANAKPAQRTSRSETGKPNSWPASHEGRLGSVVFRIVAGIVSHAET